MCGINGIFAYGGIAPVDTAVLRRTRDFMAARGPDGFGEWLGADGAVGFGHRRLSIIDLSDTGAQPMASRDGKIVVTFNGEIYNYQALRAELEGKGCAFHSRSDTEVLIHGYRIYGTAMVQRLRGMFAFGLWDADRRSLFLARDPYGIKPLYYSDDGRKIQFASSVKALIAGGDVPRDPEPAGIIGFQIFGSVPEPWTTWRAVKSLPSGSFVTIDASGMKDPETYFSLAETYCRAERSPVPEGDVGEYFRASLLDSVRHHLVADVPVGAFLSSGVDSGALVGLMRDAGQNEISTITLAFEAFRGTSADESPLAQEIAAQYGASHTTRWVGEQEFHDDLPKIMAAMDQPSIDGVNTWFVSKATREIGLKVAISGVGGDELLGGYSTFSRIPRLIRRLRFMPSLAATDDLFGRIAGLGHRVGLPLHPKTAGLLAYGRSFPGAWLLQRCIHLPSEMGAVVADEDFLREGLERLQPLELVERTLNPEPVQDFSRVAALESGLYLRNQLLRDTDWAGMAHSIEIRTPLVDSRLLAEVAPLFARSQRPDGKALLGNAPRLPLPGTIINRVKTGFGIPIKAWCADQPDWREEGGSKAVDDRLWSRTWMKKVAKLSGTANPPEAEKAV